MTDYPNHAAAVAFKMIHEVVEKLKAEGLNKHETWAVIFNETQNLQAADFGMGSDAHFECVEAQHDTLGEVLADWDDVGEGH